MPTAHLRIGVTGHRKLADLRRLRRGIDDALEEISTRFPGLPICVVSALAEGADRLVARHCIERCGAQLEVVLPLPSEDYEIDFSSPESREEFRSLLASAADVTVLPGTASRDAAYAAAGRYVLDHCDVLLALWDGEPERGTAGAGTGAVVAEARARRLPIACVPAANELRPPSSPATPDDPEEKPWFENFPDAPNLRSNDMAGRVRGLHPLPFRIRLAVAGPTGVPDSEALRAEIKKALEAVVSVLLDDESRRLLAQAPDLNLVFGIEPGPCGAAEEVVSSVIAACRTGGSSGGHVHRSWDGSTDAVDEADLLLVVDDLESSAPITERMVAKARGRRPRILVDIRPPHTLRIDREQGLRARGLMDLDAYNKAPDGDCSLPNLSVEPVSVEAQRVIHDLIDPHLCRADAAARQHQRRYRWAGLIAYGLSPVAVFAVAYSVVKHDPRGFLIELVVLAAILAIILGTDRLHSRRRWIENRFLAERLRCVRYLATCGVSPMRISIPPHQGLPDEPTYWMERAFAEIWRQAPPLPTPTDESFSRLRDLILEAWIADQRDHHRGKAAASHPLSEWLERLGMLVFVGALVAALAHVGLGLAATLIPHEATHKSEVVLTLLAITLPAVGAALGGFRSHREYSRLAQRHAGMHAALAAHAEAFSRVDSPAELQKILRRTESIMLAETQDWLVLMGAVRLHAG